MEVYEGYFENGQFIPLGDFQIPEKRRIIITVLDEAPNIPENKDAQAWNEFFAAIKAAGDEQVPDFRAGR